MHWSIEQYHKNIKVLYGIKYNFLYFNFIRTDPNLPLLQKGDFEKYGISDNDIKYLCFSYQSGFIKIPYEKRFEYKDFLESGNIEKYIEKKFKEIHSI